ncbi:glycosyltransferase [Bacillus albus]|uniref:glycosyltransferase n=1 Tax=Bacillus cereus group TaxID=86661 RepID=UPI00256FCF55|nr:glycosyltransferase [Bacillus albus]WJE70710.1 glycosyltransferase [Bacillus albus]
MKKKKILFVMTDMSLGGGPKTLLDYLKGLDNKKYDINLYLIRNEGELINEIPNDVKVTAYILKSDHRFLAMYKKIKLLFSKKQIKKQFEGYDLVIGYTEYYPTYVVAKINKYLGTKAIAWIHTDLSKNPTNFLKRIIHKVLGNKLYGHINKVICVSGNIGEVVKKIYPIVNADNKLNVIYNPNDYEEIVLQSKESISLEKNNKFKVVFVGRLSSEKNIALLIKAISIISKRHDIQLLIIGEGSEKDNLRELTRNLKIEGKVNFLGYKKNPYPYIRQGNVFVLPSNTEALPGVLIEALALNVPVIASNVGGVSEIVDHMKNGILFEKQNEKELVNAIEYVMEDFRNNENHLINSKDSLKKFEKKNSFKKIESIFNEET